MVVNGKLVNYDLSRFRNCKLPRPAICDLMQIPDFVEALNTETKYEISDAWIARIASDLVVSLRMTKEEKESMTDDAIKERRRWQHTATNVVRRERKLGVVNDEYGLDLAKATNT